MEKAVWSLISRGMSISMLSLLTSDVVFVDDTRLKAGD